MADSTEVTEAPSGAEPANPRGGAWRRWAGECPPRLWSLPAVWPQGLFCLSPASTLRSWEARPVASFSFSFLGSGDRAVLCSRLANGQAVVLSGEEGPAEKSARGLDSCRHRNDTGHARLLVNAVVGPIGRAGRW